MAADVSHLQQCILSCPDARLSKISSCSRSPGLGQDDLYRASVSMVTSDDGRCPVLGGTGASSWNRHGSQPACSGGVTSCRDPKSCPLTGGDDCADGQPGVAIPTRKITWQMKYLMLPHIWFDPVVTCSRGRSVGGGGPWSRVTLLGWGEVKMSLWRGWALLLVPLHGPCSPCSFLLGCARKQGFCWCLSPLLSPPRVSWVRGFWALNLTKIRFSGRRENT